jgi:hypothetical protein
MQTIALETVKPTIHTMAYRQKAKKPDFVATHLASESVLAKDWLNPQEDEAWKNL